MREEVLRLVLGLAALALVVVGAIKVVLPFASPILWALILGSATWPAYRRLRAFMGGRANPAALVMTVALFIVVLAPFALLGITLVREVIPALDTVRGWAATGTIEKPDWIARVPLLDGFFEQVTRELQNEETRKLLLSPAAGPLQKLLQVGKGALHTAINLLFTVFTLFFVYRDGEALVAETRLGLDRIAGGRGRHLLEGVGQTVRAVVYGWLLTAAMQGVVAMIGFWIAGVGAPVLLGLATGFAAVIPFGVSVVWIPVVVTLFAKGLIWQGVFITIWSLAIVGLIDNLLRPLFISGPAQIPFILVFFGVMGGLLAFGTLGLVLGPVFLAALLALWRQAREALAHVEPLAPPVT